MFGYVRVNKGELLVKEFEAYRGIYCLLCRALGKRYGVFSRLILSYDMTFLALVKISLSGVAPCFFQKRCPFNPTKKCNYCNNAEKEFDFVCAAAIIMFYYKVKDNIKDSRFLKKLFMYLLLPFASIKRKKAAKLFPEIEAIVSASMKNQAEVESKGTASFDEAAHCSADALGKIFSLGSAKEQKELYSFGYFVGRWVYLIDAADDIKKDLKTKSFNVFINSFSLKTNELTDDQEQSIRQTLNMSCACAIDALEKTSCNSMRAIIENILFDGMNETMNRVLKGKNEYERSL